MAINHFNNTAVKMQDEYHKVFGFWFIWAVEMNLLNELNDWDDRILLYLEVKNFNYMYTDIMKSTIKINTNTQICAFSFIKHCKSEDMFINSLIIKAKMFLNSE